MFCRGRYTSGDLSLSLDEFIPELRDAGFRIGVVVDEAHHSFSKTAEAVKFYREVMHPDFTLRQADQAQPQRGRAFLDGKVYRTAYPGRGRSGFQGGEYGAVLNSALITHNK